VYHQVFTGPPVLVLAPSVFASFGLKLVRHGHVEQGGFPCIADEHDVSSFAAVTPRRATMGDVLLPAEGDASVATGSSDEFHAAGVDEFHGGAAGL
jgi:hypothetical protein